MKCDSRWSDLNDSSEFSPSKSTIFLASCTCHDDLKARKSQMDHSYVIVCFMNLSRAENQCSRLGVTETHHNSAESLQKDK